MIHIVYLTDLQKKIETKQALDAQLSENKIVKDELDLVKGDSKVYKLIGKIFIIVCVGSASLKSTDLCVHYDNIDFWQ